MKSWEKAALAGFQKVRRARQHKIENRRANTYYGCIVAAEPDRAVSPQLRKTITEYAQDSLGDAGYAPWLLTNTAWRGEFVEGCIPHLYMEHYVVPYSVGPHRHLLANTTSRRVLQTDLLPDLGYIIHGQIYDLNDTPVATEAFASTVFKDHPYLYVKAASGGMGTAVQRVKAEDFTAVVKDQTAAVIQYPIDMHEDLIRLSPEAAATLRVTTVFTEEQPRAVAAYLRLGRQGDEHVKSSSALKVIVDLKSGALWSTGALSNWTPVTEHPDTGIAFAGISVPCFEQAIDACCQHHARVPQIKYIGWDVAVTAENRIMLFEANGGHSGVAITEASHGPIFDGLGWDKLHLRER